MGIYRSWKDDEFDEESTQSGQQGFEAEMEMAPTLTRRGSIDSQEESGDSDVDFTDMVDATERGFIPSVKPSLAFHPMVSPRSPMLSSPLRAADRGDGMLPLASTMAGTAEENFLLPDPSMDSGTATSVIDSFLSHSAYRSTPSKRCRT